MNFKAKSRAWILLKKRSFGKSKNQPCHSEPTGWGRGRVLYCYWPGCHFFLWNISWVHPLFLRLGQLFLLCAQVRPLHTGIQVSLILFLSSCNGLSPTFLEAVFQLLEYRNGTPFMSVLSTQHPAWQEVLWKMAQKSHSSSASSPASIWVSSDSYDC